MIKGVPTVHARTYCLCLLFFPAMHSCIHAFSSKLEAVARGAWRLQEKDIRDQRTRPSSSSSSYTSDLPEPSVVRFGSSSSSSSSSSDAKAQLAWKMWRLNQIAGASVMGADFFFPHPYNIRRANKMNKPAASHKVHREIRLDVLFCCRFPWPIGALQRTILFADLHVVTAPSLGSSTTVSTGVTRSCGQEQQPKDGSD
jgi:hypothetical protein